MALHATGPFHIADSDGVTILDKDGPVATFGYGKRPSEECEANALEWLHRFEKYEDLVKERDALREANESLLEALSKIAYAIKDQTTFIRVPKGLVSKIQSASTPREARSVLLIINLCLEFAFNYVYWTANSELCKCRDHIPKSEA